MMKVVSLFENTGKKKGQKRTFWRKKRSQKLFSTIHQGEKNLRPPCERSTKENTIRKQPQIYKKNPYIVFICIL